jgi:DNA-binding transcriptional MerR regulator
MEKQIEKLDMENLPELLKLNEVAKILNVSIWTLRLWDKKGILIAVRIGSRKDRRYRKEDILKILKEGTK